MYILWRLSWFWILVLSGGSATQHKGLKFPGYDALFGTLLAESLCVDYLSCAQREIREKTKTETKKPTHFRLTLVLCCNSFEISTCHRLPVNSLGWVLGSGLGQVVLYLSPRGPRTWHLSLLALLKKSAEIWLRARQGENTLSPIFGACHLPKSASGPTSAESETYRETLWAYGWKKKDKNHWISMTKMGTVCCLSEKSTKVLKVQCKHSYYFCWSIVDLQCCISFYV